MAPHFKTLPVIIVVVIAIVLVTSEFLSEKNTFHKVGSDFNITYSTFESITTSNKLQCGRQCTADQACFAVIVKKTAETCQILTKHDSNESTQMSLKSGFFIWMKQGDHGYIEPATTQSVMETTTEAGCPVNFYSLDSVGTCFFFGLPGPTATWEDARNLCTAEVENADLAVPQSTQVFAMLFKDVINKSSMYSHNDVKFEVCQCFRFVS